MRAREKREMIDNCLLACHEKTITVGAVDKGLRLVFEKKEGIAAETKNGLVIVNGSGLNQGRGRWQRFEGKPYASGRGCWVLWHDVYSRRFFLFRKAEANAQ